MRRGTQQAIERAIRAALRCGLKVVAIRSDGTVLTEMQGEAATVVMPGDLDDVAADLEDGPENFPEPPRYVKRRPK